MALEPSATPLTLSKGLRFTDSFKISPTSAVCFISGYLALIAASRSNASGKRRVTV
ncbi:Uncharacterised protein [Shigella sonnei]|nr:Uncharacterised protein [Shigella sonnei]